MAFLQRQSFPSLLCACRGSANSSPRGAPALALSKASSAICITLTSLAIGALGEATLAKLFQTIWPATFGAHTTLVTHAIALTCAFAILSALHVVIGELVPKTISLARAERVALLVAMPFRWFLGTFRWAIHLLDRISGAIVRALGITSAQVHGVAHSTEELQF